MDEKIGVGQSHESVLAEFNALWTMEEVNMNTTKMIAKLQQLGILKVSGRKQKEGPTASERWHTQHQAASTLAPLATGAPIAGRGWIWLFLLFVS